MADLLTVLTELGQSVSVEERWVLVTKRGARYTYPNRELAEAEMMGDYYTLEREVRLASDWAGVDVE